MSTLSPNMRGIAFMVIATLVFVINDTFLKLATEGLPPLQVLFMRGIAATIWCLPLVLLTGNGKKLPAAVRQVGAAAQQPGVPRRHLLRPGARERADCRHHGAGAGGADAAADRRFGALSRQDRLGAHGADRDRVSRRAAGGATVGSGAIAFCAARLRNGVLQRPARHRRAQSTGRDSGVHRGVLRHPGGDDGGRDCDRDL